MPTWVPIHAWRTLGQLRSPNAVSTLIVLFDHLPYYDWALKDLGKVIRSLRLRQGAPIGKQLHRLVAYFRSFRAGKLPDGGGRDTYLAIALSQRRWLRSSSLVFQVLKLEVWARKTFAASL